jgi:hypothetical protein
MKDKAICYKVREDIPWEDQSSAYFLAEHRGKVFEPQIRPCEWKREGTDTNCRKCPGKIKTPWGDDWECFGLYPYEYDRTIAEWGLIEVKGKPRKKKENNYRRIVL